MTEENKNINHYTAFDIQNYVEGKLSSTEMHAIEKAALEDPFLADAIEGFESSVKKYSSTDLNKDVEELHKRLHDRIDNKKKAILFSANRLWWQIAASIIVLFGAGILTWYFFTNKPENKNIAQSSIKNNSDSAIEQNKKPPTPSANYTISPKADVAVNEKKAKRISPAKLEKRSSAKQKKKENLSVENNKNASADIASSVAKTSSETVTRKKDIQNAKEIPDSTSLVKSKNITTLPQIDFQNTFTGKVIDMNKNPVSGATVMITDKKLATTTDHDGVFKLHFKKPDSTLKVTVSSVGFEPTEATLINDNDIANNTINLKSNRTALNEVVVSGYGSRARKSFTNLASDNTIKNAIPVIGWTKYKDYINKNKRLSADSTGIKIIEVVSFTIKKNGKLSNFNIEQSYNDDYDEEAIRLIKEGPAWKLLKGKKTKATLTIEF